MISHMQLNRRGIQDLWFKDLYWRLDFLYLQNKNLDENSKQLVSWGSVLSSPYTILLYQECLAGKDSAKLSVLDQLLQLAVSIEAEHFLK